MTRSSGRTGLLALLALLTACEAGPPAFTREDGGQSPLDTADVAALPTVPRAADVESGETSADGVDRSAGDASPDTAVQPAVPGDETVGDTVGDRTAEPAPDTLDDVVAMAQEVPDSGTAPASTEVAAGVAAGADTLGPPHFERPEHIRGIYLNAWAAGSRRRIEDLIGLAHRTEINTFVIDIKDASGYVSHRTQVPMSHEIGATEERRIADLPGLLRRLHDEGIYPIARIVIVKDPLLTAAHPEMAIQSVDGGPFLDGKGIVWLNPYDHAVWDYHLALAKEVAGMGFPEIQWDYVRFPDIPASEKELVSYPGAGDTSKADAIRSFLTFARDQLHPLGVRMTADVFGVTASASRDVGIGQVWESFIGAVDVALPMVYPSHYWEGSFGFEKPNAHPYEIVRRALADALRRSSKVEGAGATRPWLQDFSLGEPAYGASEVRAQIQATYDAGVEEWILWNPGSHYTEAALEPEAGFATEPMIRIANRIVPVSQRGEVLDSIAAVEAAADSVKAARRAAAADSARARALRAAADSARADPGTVAADTVGGPAWELPRR